MDQKAKSDEKQRRAGLKQPKPSRGLRKAPAKPPTSIDPATERKVVQEKVPEPEKFEANRAVATVRGDAPVYVNVEAIAGLPPQERAVVIKSARRVLDELAGGS